MKKFNFRRAFGGGGNRGVVRVACLFDDLAAKFVKDVRAIRRKDDKFETEKVVLVDSSDEYASIAEKGGKLPRTILLNEKENNTNFKKYGVW